MEIWKQLILATRIWKNASFQQNLVTLELLTSQQPEILLFMMTIWHPVYHGILVFGNKFNFLFVLFMKQRSRINLVKWIMWTLLAGEAMTSEALSFGTGGSLNENEKPCCLELIHRSNQNHLQTGFGDFVNRKITKI